VLAEEVGMRLVERWMCLDVGVGGMVLGGSMLLKCLRRVWWLQVVARRQAPVGVMEDML